jgi:hypothetical protein
MGLCSFGLGLEAEANENKENKAMLTSMILIKKKKKTDIYLNDNFEPTTPFLSDQKKT